MIYSYGTLISCSNSLRVQFLEERIEKLTQDKDFYDYFDEAAQAFSTSDLASMLKASSSAILLVAHFSRLFLLISSARALPRTESKSRLQADDEEARREGRERLQLYAWPESAQAFQSVPSHWILIVCFTANPYATLSVICNMCVRVQLDGWQPPIYPTGRLQGVPVDAETPVRAEGARMRRTESDERIDRISTVLQNELHVNHEPVCCVMLCYSRFPVC